MSLKIFPWHHARLAMHLNNHFAPNESLHSTIFCVEISDQKRINFNSGDASVESCINPLEVRWHQVPHAIIRNTHKNLRGSPKNNQSTPPNTKVES